MRSYIFIYNVSSYFPWESQHSHSTGLFQNQCITWGKNLVGVLIAYLWTGSLTRDTGSIPGTLVFVFGIFILLPQLLGFGLTRVPGEPLLLLLLC